MKTWMGPPPEKCDICGDPITDEFVDGKTTMGPWANMDKRCYSRVGIGLGAGKGQHYKFHNDEFVKVGG